MHFRLLTFTSSAAALIRWDGWSWYFTCIVHFRI